MSGESPYGQAFGIGSGYYKYAPVALYPFCLFPALPYPIAAGLYYFVVLAAILYFSVAILNFIIKEFSFHSSKNGWILAVSSIFLADHLERELHLGNVNAFLLIAVFVLFHFCGRELNLPAGLLFAAILLVKTHFAFLIPLFAWYRKWKLLVYSLAGLIVGFLLPALVSGWDNNLMHHQEWISAIKDHNLHLSSSPNTIFGLVNKYLIGGISVKHSYFLVSVLLILTIIVFTFILIINRNYPNHNRSFFIEYFCWLALFQTSHISIQSILCGVGH